MERARGLRENAARCLRLSRSINSPADVAWLEALAAEATQGAERIEAEEAAAAAERYPIRLIAAEPDGVARAAPGTFGGSGDLCHCRNDPAPSVREEYQSIDDEPLTSKIELQSLNEELSALKGQLKETLERQRATADDLQNALSSTDVSTLFLDRNLNVRFFACATKALFAIVPSDIGRPLTDSSLLALGADLLPDARMVLRTIEPIDREIESPTGSYYTRRIQPYRTQSGSVEGVVITFTDITERRHATGELEIANQRADHVRAAKSRFVAAIDHDLRQPLQILSLVQGLLAEHVESERAKKLVARLDETLSAMSGALTTLRYVNQIEAKTVAVKMADFSVTCLMERLRDELNNHAQAKGLTLRVVPCSLFINSDPLLLEQIIRNLLSIALKYTRCGKVLLGCRRHKGTVSIEVWDTGLGIPEMEHLTIFEESGQLDASAKERGRSPGLGLSIVHRLSTLLGHQVRVRSRSGMGSVFSIDVIRAASGLVPTSTRDSLRAKHAEDEHDPHVGSILIVEDDPVVRELLEVFLKDRGYDVATACDGIMAGELAAGGMVRPDLILADHTLPNDLNGRTLAIQLRELLNRTIPTIIFTGDISRYTSSDTKLQDCVQLEKPIKLNELTKLVQRLLPRQKVDNQAHGLSPADASTSFRRPVVFVVDGDESIRGAIRNVLEHESVVVEDYASAEAFLAGFRPRREACLVVGAYLPGMNGRTLLRRLNDAGSRMPTIMITGNGDVLMAVEAMKSGASDVIERPINRGDLIARVGRALGQSRASMTRSRRLEDVANHIAGLTPRQRQVMTMVLAGYPSKNIAADLRISQRTVEKHRAAIMTKTGTKSLATLARLALGVTLKDIDEIESMT
jgi:two-component system CheB/CheR fusion protein